MLPPPAHVFGFAGLIPALATLAVAGAGPADWRGIAIHVGALYAALILSFLGGAWWGQISRAPAVRQAWLLYGLAVTPSLIALGLLLPLSPIRIVLLGAAILLTLPVDVLLARMGIAPAGWMRLRIPLSIGLGALTIGLGIVSGL